MNLSRCSPRASLPPAAAARPRWSPRSARRWATWSALSPSARRSTPLEEVGEALNLDFEDEDYDTLNGLLISLIDKIPSEHEVFEVKYKGYIFEVLSVEDKMIKYVHVVPERSESAESDTATCQQDEKMVE